MERNIRDMARHVPLPGPDEYKPKDRLEHLQDIHAALEDMPRLSGTALLPPIELKSPLKLISNLVVRLTYEEMIRFAKGVDVEPDKIHGWAKEYRDEG